MTVQQPGTDPTDLTVACDALTPWRDVLAELRRAGQLPPASPALVDGRDVEPTTPVGEALRHGAVIGLSPTRPTPPRGLHAVGGHDAGRVWPVEPGSLRIGRDPALPVSLRSDAVSRWHATLVVRDGTHTLVDHESTNGCWTGGERVTAVPLRAGQPARIGGTAIALPLPPAPPLVPSAGNGHLQVNRAPRVHGAPTAARLVAPQAPAERPVPRLPWLAMLGPLVAGVALAFLMDPRFLLFSLLSPVMAGGQAASDRWHHRRDSRRAGADHAAAVRSFEAAVASAVLTEAEQLRTFAPDPAAVHEIVATPTAQLWERRPHDDDWLRLRLGLATLPSAVPVEGHERAPLIHDVPLTVDLQRHRVLGIAGSAPSRRQMGAWLLAQAAALHSPLDLRLVVLAPEGSRDWDWTRWLPHVELATKRLATLQSDPRPALVVVDGARQLRTAAGLMELMREPGRHAVICLDQRAEDLPAECRAVAAVLDGPVPSVELRAVGSEPVVGALPDLVDREWPELVARRLAPLVDATPGQGLAALPVQVRWGELTGSPGGLTPELLLERWTRPTTRVPLGVTSEGVWEVDLTHDGPHALVAGTTGAGKSEALRTLVAGLAAANPPDALSFVLVDFKGGAAFGSCADLPHVTGVVTDLDPALTERALSSLAAELRRRESLLLAAGVDDLRDYPGLAAGLEPLSRLVIVVDEFATLAEELPDFVGGLVGIAQRGRSLGVHLILATQRPEGCVSADIRANTALRLCLAVARDTESRDVLDAPDAALIPPGMPGRGFARVGSGGLVPVQLARVTAAARQVRQDAVTLTPSTGHSQSLSDPEPVPAEEGPSELDLLVAAARELVTRGAVQPARAPWLQPLPHPIVGEEDVWAIADVPERQAYAAIRELGDEYDEAARHLLIVGAPRSGRTTAVRSIVHSLVAKCSADELHLYAVDDSGALADLADLPHSGAVVRSHDVDRLIRLVSMLSREVAQRRGGTRHEQPRIVLVIDRWESAVEALEQRDGGRWVDVLHSIVSDGAAASLQVIGVLGGRGPSGRLNAVVDRTLVLRLADPSDCSMFGIPVRSWPRDLPPGRGWLVGGADAALVQVAVPRELPPLAPAADLPPRRVDPLPDSIDATEAEALRRKPRSEAGACVLLGVGGDELAPVDVDLVDAGPAFIVAGPPRSGRSTALARLATGLIAQGIGVAALLPRASAVRSVHGVVILGSGDTQPPSDHVLICDDVEMLEASGLALLESAMREAREGGPTVLLGGTAEDLAVGFRGPIADARRSRCGLILAPRTPHDGELVGVRLPQPGGAEPPPGRGFLSLRGAVTAVQVARS